MLLTIFIFNKSKIYEKEISKQPRYLIFLLHQNCINFFIDGNPIKKVHPNDKELLPVKVTSKKVHRNYVDFLPIEITLEKARQNDTEFSSIGITSRKFVGTTGKLIDIFFST